MRFAIGFLLFIFGAQILMSMLHRDTGKSFVPKYKDGRTKQTFKDETDINVILKKAQRLGSISHLNKYEPSYGDFSDYDFNENLNKLARGEEIFDALPSEIRREFDNTPSKFFVFVNDPKNVDRLAELLPDLAKPGNYFPDVSRNTPPGALLDGGEPGPVAPVVEDPPETEAE